MLSLFHVCSKYCLLSETNISCWSDCSKWYSCLFTFNILYLAKGTWRNSHFCRRFEHSGSLTLSARNWDVAAACLQSSAEPVGSSFCLTVLLSQHMSASVPSGSHSWCVNMHWFSIINYDHSYLHGWCLGLEGQKWGTVMRVNGWDRRSHSRYNLNIGMNAIAPFKQSTSSCRESLILVYGK